MNHVEQRNHKRVTDDLASGFEEFAAATVSRCDGIKSSLGRQIGAERTNRIIMAEEQRAYVDGEAARLRQAFNEFRNRTFWERLRWLFRGK